MEMCTWTSLHGTYLRTLKAELRKPTTGNFVGTLKAELRKPTTATLVNSHVFDSSGTYLGTLKAELRKPTTDYFMEASEKKYMRVTLHRAAGVGKSIFAEHLASLESIITIYIPSKPNNLVLISGVYDVDPRDNKGYSRVLKIEHCALQEFGNQWQLEVKCRPKGSKASSGRWTNIRNIYPDATVKVEQNYIELTLPTVEDSHEFAVFGTPEVKDKKRMRFGIFGGKATRGQDWNIVGTLFDDTMMAFESLCEKEERKGRQLLNILPALFISNSGEDIKIDISGLEEGWKITGNSLMTIKSKDAWNSPENSTDFPCCVFEITHVDEAKQLFSCEIKASHLNDSTETELVAFFEQANEVMTPPELPIQGNNVFDLFVFLQMLVFFVECLTGSSFDAQAPKKGSVADQVESFNSN